MKTLEINLQRNEETFVNEGETIYTVRKPFGQPSGFFNAFNVTIEGKQAKEVKDMLDIESTIYAFLDNRFKSGFRFEQY